MFVTYPILEHLGRHKGGRALHLGKDVGGTISKGGHTKVGNLGGAGAANEDVGGLEVAMDDVLKV